MLIKQQLRVNPLLLLCLFSKIQAKQVLQQQHQLQHNKLPAEYHACGIIEQNENKNGKKKTTQKIPHRKHQNPLPKTATQEKRRKRLKSKAQRGERISVFYINIIIIVVILLIVLLGLIHGLPRPQNSSVIHSISTSSLSSFSNEVKKKKNNTKDEFIAAGLFFFRIAIATTLKGQNLLVNSFIALRKRVQGLSLYLLANKLADKTSK